jgi:hypothetical protein
MIWLTENYRTQALFLTRWVGRTSHCLSPDGFKFLKYALMGIFWLFAIGELDGDKHCAIMDQHFGA